MAGSFFVLQDVTDFSPGFFEDTAADDGCVQLSGWGGGYVKAGTYTSPAFSATPFYTMRPSWNAETPPGTTMEMQVRVGIGEDWSGWHSFGVWSPYIRRASQHLGEDGLRIEDGRLMIENSGPPANRVQLRVLLASNERAHTPRVYLMAAATSANPQMKEGPASFDRQLDLPAYSCQNRDPQLGTAMAGATSLCMMMNRWGRDLLPEEVARTGFDFGTGRYDNLPYLCAVAGAYGFYSYVAHANMARLRQEVWQGRAVAVCLQAANTADETEGQPATTPPDEGAGYLAVLCGFFKQDEADWVLLHDPMAADDDSVRTPLPLAQFAARYTGEALMLDRRPPSYSHHRPAHKLVRAQTENGRLLLYDGETLLVPDALQSEEIAPATLCYTLSDGIAYASAAQRRFYYPVPDENGDILFDATGAAGRRLTVYLIDALGTCRVAEKPLGAPEAGH